MRCSTTPDFGMVELELSPTIPKTIPIAVVGVVDLIARDRDEGGRPSYFTVKK